MTIRKTLGRNFVCLLTLGILCQGAYANAEELFAFEKTPIEAQDSTAAEPIADEGVIEEATTDFFTPHLDYRPTDNGASPSAQWNQQQQLAEAPITLAPNLQGYLFEGEADIGLSASLLWENSAISQAAPVEEPGPLEQPKPSNPIESVEQGDPLELEGTEDGGLLENTSEEGVLNDPPPLPKDFSLDEASGSFSLGVIRAVPTVSFQGRTAVVHNLANPDASSFIFRDSNTSILNSAALRISPELGRRVRVDGGIQLSYIILESDSDDYNVFDADLGLRYELDRNTSAALGWKYEKIAASNTDDYSGHQASLSLNRFDTLSEQLFLNSNYEANVNLASHSDQSRWSNTATIGLAYSINPNLLAQMGYRLNYTDYFEGDSAINHQVGAQLTHYFDEQLSLTGSVTYLFGESIDLFSSFSATDIDNISFGISLGFDIPITY